jgi:arylsulfatase A-like enzyme
MNPDRAKPIEWDSSDFLLQVLGTGAVLALSLARIRWGAAGWRWGQFPPAARAVELISVTYYDLVYVTVVSIAFMGVLLGVRHRPAAGRTLAWLYVALAVLSLIMGCVNEKALRELGSPLTYQWLYYSDFLRSVDAYNAMRGLVTPGWLKVVVLKCVWLLVGGYVVARGLRWLRRRVALRWLALPLMVGLGAVLVVGHARLARAASGRAKLQNPVVRLIASAVRKDENPLLTTMLTSVSPADFLPAGARAPSQGALGLALRERARRAGVHNVLIIVVESLGAQYVGAYGGPYGATPLLDRYSRHAMRFTRVYVSVPSTIHSLTALLLSVYHPHSFRVLTAEYPRLRLPSLSGELERRGYRTAFFNAADNRFQQQDPFLEARGFDRVEDYRTFACAEGVFRAPDRHFVYLDGAADRCAVNRVAEWIRDRSGGRFFGMFWTMQTHFPYFLTEEPAEFGVRNPDLNRYLNALRETDRAVGQLLGAMEQQQVLDSTLVVVLGDHGEAFGQHGHYVHGVDLYDEEIHVPVMLINRRLFHGEADSTLGGLVDVAPTILDLVGEPLPASWQGRSLFDHNRPGRAYLFTSRSKVLFGYRDAARKFIYDAGTNTMELYDLQADPAESLNVAGGSPDSVLVARQRLAAWVQYQQRFFKGVLVPDAR